MIGKMENLKSLTQLRELHLAHNYIAHIDGIEMLTHLQVLNLSHNTIQHVPSWLPKRLQVLQVFRIAYNKMELVRSVWLVVIIIEAFCIVMVLMGTTPMPYYHPLLLYVFMLANIIYAAENVFYTGEPSTSLYKMCSILVNLAHHYIKCVLFW